MNIDGLKQNGPINIVVIGDSVTHGSLLFKINYETVYWNILKQKLNDLRYYIHVNVINAAIGCTTAKEAVLKIERAVISHNPDLIIICVGLNDVNGSTEDYIGSLNRTPLSFISYLSSLPMSSVMYAQMLSIVTVFFPAKSLG